MIFELFLGKHPTTINTQRFENYTEISHGDFNGIHR